MGFRVEGRALKRTWAVGIGLQLTDQLLCRLSQLHLLLDRLESL